MTGSSRAVAPALPAVHAYSQARFVLAIVLQDVVPALVLFGLVLLRPESAFARAFAVGAPLVLAWGAVTLHFPSRVELTADGISFHRYGRAHAFAWKDVRGVRVRRFLVGDRVLVRILPSSPWRGRYWILESIDRFDDLVRALEARA